MEFGRAFQVHNAVNRLATQYAIAWADCSDFPAGTCQTELSSFSNATAVGNIVPGLVPASISLSMFQVQMSGSTPAVTYAYPTGGALSSSQIASAQSTLGAGQSGVVVTVSYAHTLRFYSALMTPYLSTKLNPSYTVTQLKS